VTGIGGKAGSFRPEYRAEPPLNESRRPGDIKRSQVAKTSPGKAMGKEGRGTESGCRGLKGEISDEIVAHVDLAFRSEKEKCSEIV